jgi:hypothetical protein
MDFQKSRKIYQESNDKNSCDWQSVLLTLPEKYIQHWLGSYGRNRAVEPKDIEDRGLTPLLVCMSS